MKMKFQFEPNIHPALWGEEEWLVSARPDSPSRLADGSGRTLPELAPGFPLLIKRIRADRRLSVQVHPNDETARTVGGEAKTEMWCVLKGGPIFAGFKPGVTAADVERSVADGSFETILMRFDTRPGECYFIPGGLVHAIGEGTTVYEVQQSSNTTFRLYDWGRVGADGRPRQLHVKEALAAMDLTLPPPVPAATVACPYFSFFNTGRAFAAVAEQVQAQMYWRAVYEPVSGASFLLPPGATDDISADSFVTLCYNSRNV